MVRLVVANDRWAPHWPNAGYQRLTLGTVRAFVSATVPRASLIIGPAGMITFALKADPEPTLPGRDRAYAEMSDQARHLFVGDGPALLVGIDAAIAGERTPVQSVVVVQGDRLEIEPATTALKSYPAPSEAPFLLGWQLLQGAREPEGTLGARTHRLGRTDCCAAGVSRTRSVLRSVCEGAGSGLGARPCCTTAFGCGNGQFAHRGMRPQHRCDGLKWRCSAERSVTARGRRSNRDPQHVRAGGTSRGRGRSVRRAAAGGRERGRDRRRDASRRERLKQGFSRSQLPEIRRARLMLRFRLCGGPSPIRTSKPSRRSSYQEVEAGHIGPLISRRTRT
jgi:hypothetical protein